MMAKMAENFLRSKTISELEEKVRPMLSSLSVEHLQALKGLVEVELRKTMSEGKPPPAHFWNGRYGG